MVSRWTCSAICRMSQCWLAPLRRCIAFASSRYVGKVKHGGALMPSTAALSSWPMAQVRAWGRPENLRLLVMVGMLAVQAGSSAIQGLSVVAIWLLGGYLLGLLNAVMHTARAASHWLRSTPIPFAQFAWAMSRRALLYQVVATAGVHAAQESLKSTGIIAHGQQAFAEVERGDHLNIRSNVAAEDWLPDGNCIGRSCNTTQHHSPGDFVPRHKRMRGAGGDRRPKQSFARMLDVLRSHFSGDVVGSFDRDVACFRFPLNLV